MKLCFALYVIAIILPSFSTAVPHHDSRHTYLEKRQGSTSQDTTSKPKPSSPGMLAKPLGSPEEKDPKGGKDNLLGTEEPDERKGIKDTGSFGPGLPKKPKEPNTPPINLSNPGGLGPAGFPPANTGGDIPWDGSGGGGSTKPGGPTNDAINKTSNASLQMLEKILNHTLSTLPGLEQLSDQVEKMMAGQLEDAMEKAHDTPDSPGSRTDVQEGIQGSANATANKTVSITAPVEMNGTDSQGKACETYGYITLSATTLTTLSTLFQSLVKLEKTVSKDGSKKSLTILQQARAQVSFTMFSVIKLTATPAVTSCHVPPSQTTFSTQIQANVSMCAEMLTKVEHDLKAGKTTVSKSADLGIDASLGANSTMNSTVGPGSTPGELGGGGSGGADKGTGDSGSIVNPLGDRTKKPGGSDSPGNPTSVSPDGTTPNSDASLGGGDLGGSTPNDDSSTTPTDASSAGGADNSTSFKADSFAEVKASFAAAVQVTTGLVTSKPSQGKEGIHIGATVNAQVNVNIKARVSIKSSVIDNFLDRVNGGSGGQEHDALQNPKIQQQDGMGILQDIGGSVFSNIYSGISGSGGSSSGSSTDVSGGGGDNSSGTGFPDSTGGSSASPDSTGSSAYPGDSSGTGYPGSTGGGAAGANSTSSTGYPGDSSSAGLPGSTGGSGASPDSTGSSAYPGDSSGTGFPGSTGGSGASPNSTSSTGYPGDSSSAGLPGSTGGSGASPDSTGSSAYPGSSKGLGGSDTSSNTTSSPDSTGGASGGLGGSSTGGGDNSTPSPGGKDGTLVDAEGSGSGGSGMGGGGAGLGGSGGGSSSGSGSGIGSSSSMSGESGSCVCKSDSSTHLRIRSLEAQLAQVHRVMHKRGLTEL
ncbi:hypothetical protein PGT21_016450 [Puccinia graminis f. sp. tritici]|uniref:Uncharacterized protein n=1 Tax=Puccinia graminis f. sp. tritici TaxID=56615 RepID=A0A5B0QAX1_PUCGR|nr:hypothetical protein PGT21_016450 [Puccinia graminis f. sp. tritici]